MNAQKKVINGTLKQKNKKKHLNYGASLQKKNAGELETSKDNPITLEEFVKKRFSFLNERLKFFAINLYTHLPTRLIPPEVVKNMTIALDLLRSLETLLNCFNVGDQERAQPLDLLVIDEASQLKKCESTIPLQLPGIRHAVLIGDDCQLPAMVQSKISDKAEYGRSLFERLVLLGHTKQLLNVQYRMHPAISSFPNKEFYDGKILDATIVKQRSHEKRFLHGKMYGAYSFINVASREEQFDYLHSPKNMVEVAVDCKVVASLFKEFTVTKKHKRICVGVISPYKAQVHAIQEKLKTYTGYEDSGFEVSIRSVDGFHGGEANVNHLYYQVHCLWIAGNEATLVKSDSVWKKLVTDAKSSGCFFNADEHKHLAEAINTALIELQQFGDRIHAAEVVNTICIPQPL
ncbi:hypothetical protein DITRI_Ditri20bG0096300 [Diplodiscus trichospermus]